MRSASRRGVAHAQWLSVALLISTAPLAAQSTGSITGSVTGSDRTPVNGARVAVTTPARVEITDAAGKFTLRDLPAGHYDVSISAIGYKPVTKSVDVSGGQATVDVSLERGSLLLSSVVTTATRLPTEANVVASTVNVLTPHEIRTSAARESQDLLREIPSVELKRQSSLVDGSAQIVSMRGVDEGRTNVLFDGIPVGDAWGEWIVWGRVPKGLLDRVEVVEGGTSSLYGSGAIGGMISFFSRPLAPGQSTVTLDAGERSARHAFVAAGLPIWKSLTANVAGDYTSGGGYRLLDSVEMRPSLQPGTIDVANESIQRSARLRLSWSPSTRWEAFVTGFTYGDTRHTGTPLALTTRELTQGDAGFNYANKGHHLSIRAWDGNQDEHQRSSTVRTATTAPGCSAARSCEDSSLTANIPSHDWGASVFWSFEKLPKYLQSISAGADYRHMQGAFDEVDFNTTCPGTSCGTVTRTIWSGGDQALSGIFGQVIVAPIDPLRIELSARMDRWVDENAHAVDASGSHNYPEFDESHFSPRVGFRYQLPVPKAVGSLALHGAYYEAFRAPNLAELYRKQISATQVTLPNPELLPEVGEGREVGFNWQPISQVELKGTYYVADYTDFNSPFTLTAAEKAANPECPPAATATCRQRRNIGKARSEGIEGYLAVRPIAGLFVSAGVSYDDARQQSGLAAGTADDKKPHVNRVPSPRQTVRASYGRRELGTLTGIWKHEGKTTTLQGVWIDPFTVVDANYQREIVTGILGFVSVENIGDKRFQVSATTGARPTFLYGMPRTARIGITMER